jgi:hypothetical protein
MTIENYFYFVAGLLAFTFSVGHAMWGQRNILGDLQKSAMPAATKHMLSVIWNQPTVFHFAGAVALILASTVLPATAAHPLALFVGLVSLGFLLNYVVTSLLRDQSALRSIIPQAGIVLIYLMIILAGSSAT